MWRGTQVYETCWRVGEERELYGGSCEVVREAQTAMVDGVDERQMARFAINPSIKYCG
jgi:hypothetical protein